ncbi:MAG: hypothetical protein V2I47_06725 [Bacteroidales bacterium]|jgi:tetratricopeptide (TPR) repeat protein|nr:hypothetical protein [Bacteroidales bacterium]
MKFRHSILTISLTILALGILQGQNRLVSEAIQAFSEGDYQKAYEYSGDALVNIDDLSGDYVAAAWYYLAKSRIQLLRLAMEAGDQEKLLKMQHALIESYIDYKEALKTADYQLQQDIEYDLAGLYNPILQTGLSALNTGNDPQQPENVRQAALKAAKGYLEAAKDISPTYLAADLLGQVQLELGDTSAAHRLFDESIRSYKAKPPAEGDFLIAYAVFRKALIESYHEKNNPKAISTLLDGENLLKKEYSRLSAAGTLKPEQLRAYEKGLRDLIRFELELYIEEDALADDALVRFREVMLLYPDDYDIHIAYANLMEKSDPRSAIEEYMTAISIDESREIAYYNLGALYNNLGSDNYLAGLNADDEQMADSLFNKANKDFRDAYRYMEAAYRLNPYSLETIRALVQLARSLGLDEQAEMYKEKELELRGF